MGYPCQRQTRFSLWVLPSHPPFPSRNMQINKWKKKKNIKNKKAPSSVNNFSTHTGYWDQVAYNIVSACWEYVERPYS